MDDFPTASDFHLGRRHGTKRAFPDFLFRYPRSHDGDTQPQLSKLLHDNKTGNLDIRIESGSAFEKKVLYLAESNAITPIEKKMFLL